MTDTEKTKKQERLEYLEDALANVCSLMKFVRVESGFSADWTMTSEAFDQIMQNSDYRSLTNMMINIDNEVRRVIRELNA